MFLVSSILPKNEWKQFNLRLNFFVRFVYLRIEKWKHIHKRNFKINWPLLEGVSGTEDLCTFWCTALIESCQRINFPTKKEKVDCNFTAKIYFQRYYLPDLFWRHFDLLRVTQIFWAWIEIIFWKKWAPPLLSKFIPSF